MASFFGTLIPLPEWDRCRLPPPTDLDAIPSVVSSGSLPPIKKDVLPPITKQLYRSTKTTDPLSICVRYENPYSRADRIEPSPILKVTGAFLKSTREEDPVAPERRGESSEDPQ